MSDRCYKVEVYAYGLDDAAIDALFDRVADAAHELDEEVTCTGGRWDEDRGNWLVVNGNISVRLSRVPEEFADVEDRS